MKKILILFLIVFHSILILGCEPSAGSSTNTTTNNNVELPERPIRYQTVTFTTEEDFNKYFTMTTSRTNDSFGLINQVNIQPRQNVQVESLQVSFTYIGEYNNTATCAGLTGGLLEQCRRPVSFRHSYVINSIGQTNFNVQRPSNFSSWASRNRGYINYRYTGRVTIVIDD
jgi:Tfp pilus assembly protein PilX